MRAFLTVCSCFIGCVVLQHVPRDWHICKYTQPLAERKQEAEPRRLLLPTERLCISTRLSSNDQLMLKYKEIFTCVCSFYRVISAIKCPPRREQLSRWTSLHRWLRQLFPTADNASNDYLIILSMRRSCDTGRWRISGGSRPLPPLMRAWAGVSGWDSGEKGSRTVGGAEAGLFESLPGLLYSLLVDTHSVVRTPVTGKYYICQLSDVGLWQNF